MHKSKLTKIKKIKTLDNFKPVANWHVHYQETKNYFLKILQSETFKKAIKIKSHINI